MVAFARLMPRMSRSFLSRFASSLETEPSGKRFRLGFLWIPVALALIISFGSWVTGFDLAIESAIYRAGGNSWVLGDHPFWQALYDFGTIPATILVMLAVVGFVLSWSRPGFRRWRRVFLYLVLVAATGPGLLTNALLKEYWGRPRPREVEGLGGHNAFEPVLTVDLSSGGKSFPCGHATMGFLLFAGFFLFRRHRPRLAEGFLVGGLVLGALMGAARSLQGAHFPTDTVWAAVVCWFSALGLYYWLGLDGTLVRRDGGGRTLPLWAKIGGVAAGIAVLAGVAFGTPFRDVRNFYPVAGFAKEKPVQIWLKFAAGEIDIVPGEEFHVEGESYGHGLPTSNIAEKYREVDHGDYAVIGYAERISGFLVEGNQQLRVTIPWHRVRLLRIEIDDATVWLAPPPLGDHSPERVSIAGGNGTLFVTPSERRIAVSGGEKTEIEMPMQESPGKGKPFRITISEEFDGRLSVQAESP